MKQTLAQLPGLGPKAAAMLSDAGIDSVGALKRLGAVRAFIQLCRHNPKANNLNFLYALEGAVTHRDWREIAKFEKGRLLIELDAAQQSPFENDRLNLNQRKKHDA